MTALSYWWIIHDSYQWISFSINFPRHACGLMPASTVRTRNIKKYLEKMKKVKYDKCNNWFCNWYLYEYHFGINAKPDSSSISNYVELLSMVSIKSQIQVNYVIEKNKSDVKCFVLLPSSIIRSNSSSVSALFHYMWLSESPYWLDSIGYFLHFHRPLVWCFNFMWQVKKKKRYLLPRVTNWIFRYLISRG